MDSTTDSVTKPHSCPIHPFAPIRRVHFWCRVNGWICENECLICRMGLARSGQVPDTPNAKEK